MMKRFLPAAVAVLGLLLFTGCVREDAVKIYGLDSISVSMQGGTTINAIVDVGNTSSRNIRISDVYFTINDLRGNEVGDITVDSELYVPKKRREAILIPMKVRLSDPVSGMRLLKNLDDISNRITVNGSAVVKMGAAKKKVVFENVLFSTLISTFESVDPQKTPMILDNVRQM